MKKSLLTLVMILLTTVFLPGCMISHRSHTSDSSTDHSISKTRLESVEPGVTTKGWIIENFGEPDKERQLQEGGEVLVYENTRHRTSHFSLFLLFNSHTSEDIKDSISFKIRDGIVQSYWAG